MKNQSILYFDCFSGISGDMILGAFVDMGLSPARLAEEIEKLKIGKIRITAKKAHRGHLSGTKLDIRFKNKGERRTLSQIRSIILRSDICGEVKKDSVEVFQIIHKAETKIHGGKHPKLHELGDNDTLIDVVGACWALRQFRIKECYSSAVNLGRGVVRFSDGILPVPAPATLEIMKGLPVYGSEVPGELTTPTGASLLKHFVKKFSPIPRLKPEKIGYGAGDRVFRNFPNLLRIIVGSADPVTHADSVLLLETNMDDLNPQVYGYVFKRLFENGALDVWLTSIYMKKGRPGIKLSVLCDRVHLERLRDIVFRETTTLGIRQQTVDRVKLARKEDLVRTPWGTVRAKRAGPGKVIPEYRDCCRIAKAAGIPLFKVIEKAKEG